MTIRIAMWSGPRNISTAMMRSFGGRADSFVSDEPFYGAFLKASGAEQPMREAVIASMDCDWASVTRAVSGDAPDGSAIWYQKHMPHHMIGPIGIADLPDHVHAFLIRDPARVIASYAAKRVSVTAEDLGYARQRAYFESEAERTGRTPPVIDSSDVLADPEGVLRALCIALGIPWDAGMLRWEPGRRETDGIWAEHWYGRVEASSGFEGGDGERPEIPEQLRGVEALCRPHYEALARYRLLGG